MHAHKFVCVLKIYLTIVIISIVSFFSGQAYSEEGYCYSKMSKVLGCFLSHENMGSEDNVYGYKFVKEDISNPKLTVRTYILTSQKWPLKDYHDIPTTKWEHQLLIYIPKDLNYSYKKALLYVTGGLNRDTKGIENFSVSKEQINYANLAIENNVLVVELRDVPNQYLVINGRLNKEDQILAYAYKKVMEDPMANAYLAPHLPMAKAVIKAMDAVQKIAKEEIALEQSGYEVVGFILAGASKRGWAIWLAALADKRVEAMIPIVIDTLNTQKSMMHIRQSYGGTFPISLKDYVECDINGKLQSQGFAYLMDIEDPYNYLKKDYDSKYKERLAIPKYVINSSGDEFFVPDSSRWYFKDLPGEHNYLRYLPNARHYFSGNLISDALGSRKLIEEALSNYLYFILNRSSLPKITKEVFHVNVIELTSSIRPSRVLLWVANNDEARDFRCISSGIAWVYLSFYSQWDFINRIKGTFFNNFISWICDNYYKENVMPVNCKEEGSCDMHISLPASKKGWQASFVELHYDVNGKDFVITTGVNITPDTYPVEKIPKEL